MKPTNPMAQLQQWKVNNTKRLVSDGGASVNGVHPNALKIEPVQNCETGCEFAKAQKADLHSAQKTQQEMQGEAKNKYQGKTIRQPLSLSIYPADAPI